MPSETERSLLGLFKEFKVGEILRLDLLLGLLAGAGAVYLAIKTPASLANAIGPASQVVALIVGFSIAGIAIQVAFMDQSFLRKIRAIHSEPVHFLTPLLFTAAIGTVGAIGLLVYAALPGNAPVAARAVMAGIAGFFVVWTLCGLFYNLATLVSFVRLQNDALDVPDDIGAPPGPPSEAQDGDGLGD